MRVDSLPLLANGYSISIMKNLRSEVLSMVPLVLRMGTRPNG